MVRLFAAVLVALLLPLAAGGTLVTIVPYADGLVIAADSVTTVMGTHCNDQFKITQLKRPPRTVVAVTGAISFIPQPANSVSCHSVESAPRLLDIYSVAAHGLEHYNGNIADLSLEALSADCISAVQQFQRSHPDALTSYIGKEIFSVVIAHYDPKSKSSVILNFVVRIDSQTREIRADRLTRLKIAPNDRRGVWSFGETDYLNRVVFAGPGRKYLCKSTLDFILDNGPVSQAQQNEAVGMAVNVIDAASRTVQLEPSPSAIGGPIHAVILDRFRQPREIPLPPNSRCEEDGALHPQ